MSKPLISVIVPLYNVEEFLSECVESILNQTYKNLELLLIDDGSTDKSPEICDGFCEKDKRVKVFHNQNQGSAASRNQGIEKAEGDFVSFVDSDDILDDRMLEILLENLLTTDSDISVCSYSSDLSEVFFDERNDEKLFFDKTEAMKSYIVDGPISNIVWNKLYKRSVLSNARFVPGKTIDDVYFTYKAIANANKTVFTPQKLYYYRRRPNSIMGIGFSPKWLEAVYARIETHNYIVENIPSLTDESQISIINTCIFDGQCAYKYLSGTERKQTVTELSKIIKQYDVPKSILEKYSTKMKLWLFLARLCFPMTCKIRAKFNVGF